MRRTPRPWVVLLVAGFAGAARADLERDCTQGKIAACVTGGYELARDYRDKGDIKAGERALRMLEISCRAKNESGCDGLVNLGTGKASPQLSQLALQRACDLGRTSGCNLLAFGDPARKTPIFTRSCALAATFDQTTSEQQWFNASIACSSLAGGPESARTLQLQLLAGLVALEAHEAHYLAMDTQAEDLADQRDYDKQMDSRPRPTPSYTAVDAARDLQAGLNSIAAQQQRHQAYGNALVQQAEQNRRNREASRAAVASPPAGSSAPSRGTLPPQATLPPASSPNARPAGNTPLAQASPQQIAQARQQCMQQTVVQTHVTENNVFGFHAQHYEGHLENARKCPDAWDTKKTGDHTRYWDPCIGMNARVWSDSTVKMDLEHTVQRARKVNVPFPEVPGIEGTRNACVTNGRNNCIHDLQYKIRLLWDAYNRYSDLIAAEGKQRLRAAEEARDAECRRRYP